MAVTFLRVFLLDAGFTHEDLAGMTGYARSRITLLAQKRMNPTPVEQETIGRALGFDADEAHLLFEPVTSEDVRGLVKARYEAAAAAGTVVSPEVARHAAEKHGVTLRTTNAHGVPEPPDFQQAMKAAAAARRRR